MVLQTIAQADTSSPLDALIQIATEQPLIFIASIFLWAMAGMFAFWAFIKKERINPMLLSFLFGIVAIALLFLVFYINPQILDLAQENFLVFIVTLAGSAVFGALFLPLVFITLITAVAGMTKGQ
jgi:hypothetical protein